jgi:Fe-S oxidoreductase
MEHVEQTKVDNLATGCSFCMINFNSARGKTAATENLNIQDVASILAESVGK